MGSKRQASRPQLQQWLDVYEGIYNDFMQSIEDTGVSFALAHAHNDKLASLKLNLRNKGAWFRNGDASISNNGISTACEACTGGSGSRTFYYSLQCNRDCYFCFNNNQSNYEEHIIGQRDWRGEFAEMLSGKTEMTHLALTGGEPLLFPQEALSFFETAHKNWPNAHLRLYTTGYQLNEDLLELLVSAGLSEIRFSIKLDDESFVQSEAIERIRMAKRYKLDVMVEMPVIPGTLTQMKELLLKLDSIGIYGINLLEFCYAFNNWAEFQSRGFTIKNPPFPVLYDYVYAGSLPISESEIECLKLLEFAIDQKLNLGVHYCSLENKHRDQIRTQNTSLKFRNACYVLDNDDYFLKTCKVFDGDVELACRYFEQMFPDNNSNWQRPWNYDPEDNCCIFHPRFKNSIKHLSLEIATSYNVLEPRGNDTILRELALVLEGGDRQ